MWYLEEQDCELLDALIVQITTIIHKHSEWWVVSCFFVMTAALFCPLPPTWNDFCMRCVYLMQKNTTGKYIPKRILNKTLSWRPSQQIQESLVFNCITVLEQFAESATLLGPLQSDDDAWMGVGHRWLLLAWPVLICSALSDVLWLQGIVTSSICLHCMGWACLRVEITDRPMAWREVLKADLTAAQCRVFITSPEITSVFISLARGCGCNSIFQGLLMARAVSWHLKTDRAHCHSSGGPSFTSP